MKMTIAQDIAAPPDVVFARIADIPRWADNISGIDSIEMLTEGPVQVGTRFRETRTLMGKQATEEMTVAEFDPPNRITLDAESRGNRYRSAHICEPTPTGTRVRMDFEGTPISFGAKLLAPLCVVFAPMMKKCVTQDLKDLQATIEGAPSQ
jgi:carbon monoxide dehydrogenase subunit G